MKAYIWILFGLIFGFLSIIDAWPDFADSIELGKNLTLYEFRTSSWWKFWDQYDELAYLLSFALSFICFQSFAATSEARKHLFVILGRLFLSGVFIGAAWHKLTDPAGFAMLIAQYQMMPSSMVNFSSLWMSSIEIVVGVGLLIGFAPRTFYKITAGLFFIFLIALIQAQYRELGIACGCFEVKGATSTLGTWAAIIRDILFIWILVWIWRRTPNKTSRN
jgi:uncharacterized membrane protein YphA (DoxX/SURF4 family)